MENEVITTRHCEQRCKDRLGLSKKYASVIAQKALNDGLKYEELRGSLKNHVTHLYESHNYNANNIIVYNRKLFVFNNNILITILPLANEYCAKYDFIMKKKKIKKHK